MRINQLDASQYSSSQEYNLWAYSTCSTASMTEVINAYDSYYHMGRQYRITDILKVEASIHEITPDLGLLQPTGLDRTAARFNFQVTWLNNPSLDQLIKVAASGRPIIVNFPPDRWSGGHLLVVRGGNSKYVYLADSSRLNMQAMARPTFLKYWAGFAAVMTPINKKK
jgi:ABC-type bacteriocin/lantibiotic exporter with double-glycine peptidase domain